VSDATRQAEIAREQDHVDRVYARVDTLRAEAEQSHKQGHQLAFARTPGSLVERDAMVFHAARRMRALDAEYEGLVFGRLDLTDGEVHHVGRLGLRDADYEPLVVDWRAPAAAAFYQATAEDPMGVIRRRVITCQGARVLDVEDDLLDSTAGDGPDAVPVVGDGALLATLARAKGERMRDIVATIQREQDEAIRAPAGGVTLIEGGPGTGKTAVALHRAAHLLYRDRRRFEGGGVLLVGPSPVFMSYVERVLPSLGEDTAELRALGQIVDGISTDRLDPPELAAAKGTLRMRRVLQNALREAPLGAPTEFRLVYGAQLLRLREAQLGRVRRDLHHRFQHPNAAGAEVRRALIQALWADRPQSANWLIRTFADDVADRDEFEAFVQAWWPIQAPGDVLAGLADPDRLRRAGRDWLSVRQAGALAGSWAGAPEDLSVADVALVDELRALLGEPPKPNKRRNRDSAMGIDFAGDDIRELSTVTDRYYSTPDRPPRPDNYDGYAHILVDEAQDLSPMQWRMLGRRGGQASWTIVGDAAQSAWPDLPEADKARAEAVRGRQIRRFHLGTNYRNSAEIFEFAASVVRRAVPDADLPDAVRRTGAAPEHRHAEVAGYQAAARAAVVELLGAVAGTVGVIAPTARRDEVAAELADLDERPDPGRKTRAPGGRLQVVDGMRAKGMEYDGVVLLAPDEIAAESSAGIRVLYVALTRATHRLVTIAATDRWRP
jgi:hypothetical protein